MKFDFYRKVKHFFEIHLIHKMTKSVIFWTVRVHSKSDSKTFLFGARKCKKYSQRGESQLQTFLCIRKRPHHPSGLGRFWNIKKAIFTKKVWNQARFLWKYEVRFWFFHLRISFRCWKTCLHVFMSVKNVQNIIRISKSTKAPLMIAL